METGTITINSLGSSVWEPTTELSFISGTSNRVVSGSTSNGLSSIVANSTVISGKGGITFRGPSTFEDSMVVQSKALKKEFDSNDIIEILCKLNLRVKELEHDNKILQPFVNRIRHDAALTIQRAFREYMYKPGTGKEYKKSLNNYLINLNQTLPSSL